jgi:hypothetical protein
VIEHNGKRYKVERAYPLADGGIQLELLGGGSMSLNSIIRAAITPIVPECVPDQYTGTATEYCTFNYSEIPDAFGDESPHAIRYLVQLHYFLPTGANPYTKKKQLKNAC